MDDLDVLAKINTLVDEEHHLLARREGAGASAEEHERLGLPGMRPGSKLACWWQMGQRMAGRPNPSAPRPTDRR